MVRCYIILLVTSLFTGCNTVEHDGHQDIYEYNDNNSLEYNKPNIKFFTPITVDYE